jgi:acetolactate synthase-1/2/3 large subunit
MTNSINGAEAMVKLLEGYDVKHIFGLCGDTTLPFYDALYRLDHGIQHILTRDERSAAYMADGYARVTGKVGVCEGPSGGGATHILPGVIEANESSVSVLSVTSDVAVSSIGKYPLTELDQGALFNPLTKWNGVINHPDRLAGMVRAAFRAMTTGTPGSAHLGFPFDIQKATVNPDDVWTQSEHGSFPAWRTAPDSTAIEAAADALLKSKNPIIICGGGVVLAGAESVLAGIAEQLNLVVATTISGQGSLADSHPNCLGVVGSNGGVPETRAVVDGADLVIFLGCRAGSVTTERWCSPTKSTRIIHFDSDPMAVSANYQTDVAVIGDMLLALRLLQEALHATTTDHIDFKGDSIVATVKEKKFSVFQKIAAGTSSPIAPERVIADLNAVAPTDAIIVADPGTPCPYFSAFYPIPHAGRHFISNRAHGALGYSMAAAIGAQFGKPDSKVIAAMGDGSFGFTAGEMETISRYQLPITMLVFSNSVFGWIKAGQKSGFDKRYYSVDFSQTDHAAIAAAYGIKSWRVEDPNKLQQVLREAIEHPGPTLVDIITQPLQDANAPVSEWVA